MTVGPWKPISLETYTTRITEVDIRVNIAENYTANVDVNFILSAPNPVVASVMIFKPSGDLQIGGSEMRINGGEGKANFAMTKGAYEPWWPVGYGEQPIYVVEITITDQVWRLIYLI